MKVMFEIKKNQFNLHFIVVTYNGQKWIKQCLDSIRSLNLRVTTHIIDNGSTDDTLEICNLFDVQIIPNRRNLGFGAANNLGIRNALNSGASHVFLLNQDAYLEPDALEKFLANPVSHRTDRIFAFLQLNGTGSEFDFKWSEHYTKEENCPNFLGDFESGNLKGDYPMKFANAAAWLIPRSLIENVGGFSPVFFHYGEDDNYIHRAHYHGYGITLLPECKVRHDRIQSNGGFHSEIAQKERTFLLRISNPTNSDGRFKIILRAWRVFFQKRIAGSKKEDCIEYIYIELLRKIGVGKIIECRKQSLLKAPSFL